MTDEMVIFSMKQFCWVLGTLVSAQKKLMIGLEYSEVINCSVSGQPRWQKLLIRLKKMSTFVAGVAKQLPLLEFEYKTSSQTFFGFWPS